MKLRTCLLAGVLMLGWPGYRVAGAAEYYVAQQNPAADDANPGTAEKPFKTLNAAMPKLRAGDTLWIRAGTYRESLSLQTNAWSFAGLNWPAFAAGESVAKPVRIFAAPGEEVVVKASDAVGGWKPFTNAVWVVDWPHNSQQVFCDEQPLQQIGGEIVPDLMIWWRGRVGDGLKDMKPGSFFIDLKAKKLYVWLADGGDPNAHLLEAGVRPIMLFVATQHLHVRGLKFRHGNMTSIMAWPSSSVHGRYNILEDCEFNWCDFGGLGVTDEFNTLIRCKTNHNGDSGFGANGRGHRFIDCEFSYNNTRRFSSGWHAGGMKFMGYDIVFSGCSSDGNIESPGFWQDCEASQFTIENCRAIGNGGPGIMIEIGERALLRNNLCASNQTGIYLSNASRCDVVQNLLYHNTGAGIAALGVERINAWFFDDDRTGYGPARQNVIWGNVFVDNGWRANEGHGVGPDLILPNPEIASNDGNLSDYNLFWHAAGTPIPFQYNWGEQTFVGLTNWQQQTGQDKHSVVAEPLFADAARLDFHPVKGSPAIRFVRPRMAAAAVDADNRPRDSRGYYTAGPFEAGPGLAPPPPPLPTNPPPPAVVALPTNRLVALPAPLAPLAAALKAMEHKTLTNGASVIEFKGIPFRIDDPAQCVLVSPSQNKVRIPIRRGAKKLYLLHALLDPQETTLTGLCKVLREDGAGIGLCWVAGQNLGPSVGPWPAGLKGKPSGEPGDTEVIWSAPDGSLRIFLTTWDNENYWYPLRELEWCLMNGQSTLVILGVTVQPDK